MENSAPSFFDTQAAEWDAKPDHLEMAKRAVDAVLARVSLSAETSSVLEFGCGTGLCSFLLAPHVARIVGVDTSTGMVEQYNAKASRLGLQGKLQAVQLQLESPREQLGGLMPQPGFDLVFSHLTLHHVADIVAVMQTLTSCLAEGVGVVAISDFESGCHSREFHPSHMHGEVEHHGIAPEALRGAMEAAGLSRVEVVPAFEFEKSVESGGCRSFPFLLGLGHRD